jgi:hypothetical protein
MLRRLRSNNAENAITTKEQNTVKKQPNHIGKSLKRMNKVTPSTRASISQLADEHSNKAREVPNNAQQKSKGSENALTQGPAIWLRLESLK